MNGNMNSDKSNNFLFEISWEVSNKIGGIYTVLTTKASETVKRYGDNYIAIGPDLIRESTNPDFIEDKELFCEWKSEFEKTGIKVRCGKWNIKASPNVILVDFTALFGEKDKIFTDLWNEFGLDSIAGRWDYIEAAMFGYAAGKLIHSFHDFNNLNSGTIAHFHEWMTGAGVLYLKWKAPYIGTVFTTHATILGRTLAGNKVPLYSKLQHLQPAVEARNFNIRAKYSMEKTCAANADIFTTVSEVTSEECKYILRKKADVVTPNGFDTGFVPESGVFKEKKQQSRKKILEGLEKILGYAPAGDSILALNSGRYEFHNKGIDAFIDALELIKNEDKAQKDIIGVIAVPAASGELTEAVKRRMSGDFSDPTPGFLSHKLFEPQNDPVLKSIESKGFGNEKNARVKIVFLPVYLNGHDGLFNMKYYEFLHGFDLTVFPSYYEPWGYTPMESAAFGIPSITSDLAGYGRWILPEIEKGNRGAAVVKRNDDNYNEAVSETAKAILEFAFAEDKGKREADAFKLAENVKWTKLISRYFTVYQNVDDIVNKRMESIDERMFQIEGKRFTGRRSNAPHWKKAFVAPKLPKELTPLMELSKNLWWTWNKDAAILFKSIDAVKWKKFEYNPIALIESLSLTEIQQLAQSKDFMTKLGAVYSEFKKYMSEPASKDIPPIAYFSMEFGIHDTVKIFSGGLGILAGDYLKEISDQNIDLAGVGLLYRYGYFKQTITAFGDQIAESKPQKFTHLPIQPVLDDKGEWREVKIGLPGRTLTARIWQLNVGRVKLFLLDTDIESNSDDDRKITAHLYGGDREMRLLQEILLGVGGVRALESAGVKPGLYHLNEGHAAMAGLERLRNIIHNQGLNFKEALEVVRSSSLFTTHTPVPAGHDKFSEDLVRRYLPHYAQRLGISWDDFMALGREDRYNGAEEFSMSVLAAKLSQEMNGVSALHGAVSRKMFASMYKGYFPEELHIGHVTNGVHWPTWTAKKWQLFFEENADNEFSNKQNNIELWQKTASVDNGTLWSLREHLREKLIHHVKQRLEKRMKSKSEDPALILRQINGLHEDTLTIGFARRFATYKRALLVFSDLDRLAKIVNNPEKPVQFIFAGKAHPADKAGQDLIKRIVEISKMPQFAGKIFFLENYDITLAKKLVQGVDVWLNNPTRPLEASGTSGEKAVMNGVLNLSVLDGWWAEGYVEGAGWALEEQRTFDNQELQNRLDAENIYSLLENEITEIFYKRDKKGIPAEWVEMIKKNFAEIAPHFTMNRMVEDYINLYYSPLAERHKLLVKDDFAMAKELAAWKRQISNSWQEVETLKIEFPHEQGKALQLGDEFPVDIWLKTGDIPPQNIKVEFITANKEGNNISGITSVRELALKKSEKGIAHYSTQVKITRAGVFNFAFRVYPWREELPHRMDFPIVEWI